MRSSREGSASVPDPRRPIAATYSYLHVDSTGIHSSASTLQHPAAAALPTLNTPGFAPDTSYRKASPMNVKTLVSAVVLASTLAAPVVSFAQSSDPAARAPQRR